MYPETSPRGRKLDQSILASETRRATVIVTRTDAVASPATQTRSHGVVPSSNEAWFLSCTSWVVGGEICGWWLRVGMSLVAARRATVHDAKWRGNSAGFASGLNSWSVYKNTFIMAHGSGGTVITVDIGGPCRAAIAQVEPFCRPQRPTSR